MLDKKQISNNNYVPRPIDTSKVILPQEILELAEILSKNTHEVWASAKLKEGYVYNYITNDITKTHSCLLPYENLTQTQKSYNLITSLETAKLLIALGFRIEQD